MVAPLVVCPLTVIVVEPPEHIEVDVGEAVPPTGVDDPKATTTYSPLVIENPVEFLQEYGATVVGKPAAAPKD